MKKLTNQGKSFIWGAAAIIVYAVPLLILAIINKDKLFTSTQTALTFFSIVVLVFFIIFAKKTIKKLCGVLTPLGFGSLIVMLLSLGLRTLIDDLFLISLCSFCGSVAAWFPFQLAAIYSRNAYDDRGNVITAQGLSFKQALNKIFQLSIIAGEETENE